jgi:hypothetical protein
MDSLEQASFKENILPFTIFLKEEMEFWGSEILKIKKSTSR